MSDSQENVEPVGGVRAKPLPRWMWIGGVAFLALVLPMAILALAFMFNNPMAGGSGSTSGVGPAVALINVEGAIYSGATAVFGDTGANSTVIIEQLERANDDSSVRAIVLRVNSPGGEVVASDEIHHVITQLDKPVIVSMGTLAASGGYYISAPADYIYANPYTFTGSIGVISQIITAEDLLDEYGVEVTIVASGELKDFGSFHRDVSEEELLYWQALIDEAYEGFVDVVAEGRGLSREEVYAVADGRILSGRQALEAGLVDELGYIEDAIAKAAELGGIEGEPRVVEYEISQGFGSLLAGFTAGVNPWSEVGALIGAAPTRTLEYRFLGN